MILTLTSPCILIVVTHCSSYSFFLSTPVFYSVTLLIFQIQHSSGHCFQSYHFLLLEYLFLQIKTTELVFTFSHLLNLISSQSFYFLCDIFLILLSLHSCHNVILCLDSYKVIGWFSCLQSFFALVCYITI